MRHTHALVNPTCRHKWEGRYISMDDSSLGRGSGPIYMAISCDEPGCDSSKEIDHTVLKCSEECCMRAGAHEWLADVCTVCGVTTAQIIAREAKHEMDRKDEERRRGAHMRRFEERTTEELLEIFRRYGIKDVDLGLMAALVEKVKEYVEWY